MKEFETPNMTLVSFNIIDINNTSDELPLTPFSGDDENNLGVVSIG